jgi:DNA-binding transcriptional regulator YiaG
MEAKAMSCRKRTDPDDDRRRFPDGLGERLYSWRERCNLSQSEAALKLKVSKRTLQEWEQGRATPAHLALAALEGVIGRSIKPPAGRHRKHSHKR